jgi:hypothetical protein
VEAIRKAEAAIESDFNQAVHYRIDVAKKDALLMLNSGDHHMRKTWAFETLDRNMPKPLPPGKEWVKAFMRWEALAPHGDKVKELEWAARNIKPWHITAEEFIASIKKRLEESPPPKTLEALGSAIGCPMLVQDRGMDALVTNLAAAMGVTFERPLADCKEPRKSPGGVDL